MHPASTDPATDRTRHAPRGGSRSASLARAALAVCVGVVLGIALSLSPDVVAQRPAGPLALPYEEARLLSDVLARVKRDYVEEVDERVLVQRAVKGMVASLDSHSTLLEAPDYERVRVNTTGAYSGVGLELAVVEGAVHVADPVADSPAARAGVRAGDRLLAVDGERVRADELDAVQRRLRGAPGTHVALTVEREGAVAPLRFELTRGSVAVHAVHAELLEPGYGYLRIVHFNDRTAADVERLVGELQAGGRLQGLVLDLRNNPGGVLEAGVDVADAFLDRGTIVSASGRAKDAVFTMRAAPGDLLDGAKLTLLVNGGSASASEIVAGALRDNRRATLVGRTTYGKGSVQTVMPLPGGRALKITTSRYYTPSGESIAEKGISPDVVVPRDLVKLQPAALGGGAPPVLADPEVAIALEATKGTPRESLLAGLPAAGTAPDTASAAAAAATPGR